MNVLPRLILVSPFSSRVKSSIFWAISKATRMNGRPILSAPSAAYRKLKIVAAWMVVNLGSPVISMAQSLFASHRKAYGSERGVQDSTRWGSVLRPC